MANLDENLDLEYPILLILSYINIYLWYTKSVLIRPRLFLGEFHPSYLQGLVVTIQVL